MNGNALRAIMFGFFAVVTVMGLPVGRYNAMAADGPPSSVPGRGRMNQPKTLSDQPYVENGHERQKLDLYLPAGAESKAGGSYPLIIWIHGGGWAAGSKDRCPAQRLTAQGFAVASINYRLSSHAVFPAQIEDCKAAVRWLRANAAKYKLDPNKFGVWGSSAGGHLVALLGTTGKATQYDVGAHLDVSSGVQAVCDFYGPTDLLQMSAKAHKTARLDHDAADSPESKLIGAPIHEAKEKTAKANPIVYIEQAAREKVLPPYLIVHGSDDPAVPTNQSELLYAALKATGTPVHLHIIDGAGHGKGFGGPEIEEMVVAFFKETLMTTGATTATASADHFPVTHSKAVEERRNPNAMAEKSDRNEKSRPASTSTDSSSIPSRPSGTNTVSTPQGRVPAPNPNSGSGTASVPGTAPTGQSSAARARITWEEVCRREGIQSDGQVAKDKFRGPPAVFTRLDRNGDGVLTKADFEAAATTP